MNKSALALFAAHERFALKVAYGIAEEEAVRRSPLGSNSPVWQIGHLATVNNNILLMLGGKSAIAANHGPLFGPGSKPEQGTQYPRFGSVVVSNREVHKHAALAFSTADQSALAAPFSKHPLAELFPTVGEFTTFLMTTHEVCHLTQLNEWRRQMGRPVLDPVMSMLDAEKT